MEYVEYGVRAGLDVDEFAPRLSFFFNSHNDLFEEVAKFRAARRIWAKVMRDRYGAKDPRSWHAPLPHADRRLFADRRSSRTTTSSASPSRRWPRCSAARSRCTRTRSMRRWPCRPKQAARIALRTQQIIAHESGVINTVDPLGGSFFIEELTNRMEKGCFDYIEKIDAVRRHGRSDRGRLPAARDLGRVVSVSSAPSTAAKRSSSA